MTASRRRTSSAESPRAGGVEVLGRSSLSQGLLLTRSMRMQEAEEGGQAGHAGADGDGGGVLAGNAPAVGPDEDLLDRHLVRGFATRPKKS